MGELSVRPTARDIFGQHLSRLRQGFPGLATGLNGGSYPVPLKLSTLRMPGNGVLERVDRIDHNRQTTPNPGKHSSALRPVATMLAGKPTVTRTAAVPTLTWR
jgi:hypothetical protein